MSLRHLSAAFLALLLLDGGGIVSGAPPASSYTVYVSNERSGDVSEIDPHSSTVTATFAVGKRPRGIHVSPDGTQLFIAVSGSPRLGPGADPERARTAKADKSADGIAIVDIAARRVQRKLFVGSDPEQLAVSRDGTRFFVANEDEAAASCWDIASGRNVFRTAVSGEPEGVAVHPHRPDVYITCEEEGDVFVLDAETGQERARMRVGGRPRSVAFLPDGSRAYVPVEGKASVAVIDAHALRIVTSIAVPGVNALPMGAVMSADGRELFVTTGRGNTVAVIDTATNASIAKITVGGRPWGIALSPDGTRLYTANGATNDVSVVDVRSRKEIGRIKVGDGPWGIAVRVAR